MAYSISSWDVDFVFRASELMPTCSESGRECVGQILLKKPFRASQRPIKHDELKVSVSLVSILSEIDVVVDGQRRVY